MKSEEQLRDLQKSLKGLEGLPAWFINKPDLEAIEKTLLWVLGD